MKKPEEMAWEMFEKTGKPGYYMLYKKLKGKSDNLRRVELFRLPFPPFYPY